MNFTLKHLACTIFLVLSIFGIAYAAGPAGKQVKAAIELQGGSGSNAKWLAPLTSAYKVHVFVPRNGTTTNALYRIYPKGKRAGSTECLGTDTRYPCYEATINQTLHQNTWTQLTVNNDPATQWEFVKGRGYVTAVASNLSAAELFILSSFVRFENQTIAIGNIYQGGLIFYIDATGEHGLVAAPIDQSTSIQWTNGSLTDTGATAINLGTGQANTTKITQALGAGAYAASLAANLVLNGYDDWFLPSKGELDLMYKNIGPGAPAPLTNVGGFVSSFYWSSSEWDSGSAWYQEFSNGFQGKYPKYNTYYFRAVRAF
jgi:hypothetical protein